MQSGVACRVGMTQLKVESADMNRESGGEGFFLKNTHTHTYSFFCIGDASCKHYAF